MSELQARPELRRLWHAAHRRLERTGGRVQGVAAVVTEPSAEERQAVDRMLGVRSRGRSLRVPLDRLDALLRERAGSSLAEVVAAACGPLRDRPAERAAATAAEAEFWQAAAEHPATGRHEALSGWLARVRAVGAHRRLDDPVRRVGEALDVLEHLPAPETVGRARLAAKILGDSHSLDDSAPTGRLVIAALAYMAGADEAPLAAATRRQLWGDHGVSLDETSSTVLTLGLRPVAVGPLTEAASRWAQGGLPLPLPLAAVRAERWRAEPETLVSVCENATVVEAAAARFGQDCPPMVCVEGNPSLAARLLLTSLVAGGAELRYHGDFGAGGIAIGNIVIGELGAKSWRFDSVAHAAALAAASANPRPCRPIAGRVPVARWDAELAPAIERCGVEVEEEHVLEDLLADVGPSRVTPAI
mgnify:CR=1 FL=1